MANDNFGFKINSIDHVALKVTDLNTSVEWYEKVLGLKKYQLPEWGDYPIFMLSNQTGVALIPINAELKKEDRLVVKGIDHFVFKVSSEDFKLAQQKLSQLGIEYKLQDHHYFHSTYIKDPDNNTVELTTMLVDPESFY